MIAIILSNDCIQNYPFEFTQEQRRSENFNS
jgi:hypothetical protein